MHLQHPPLINKSSRNAPLRLHIGAKFTGITLEPDGALWRVRQLSFVSNGDWSRAGPARGELSDITNISRAKDAAIAWARPKGLGGDEVVHWHRRQGRAEGAPVRSATGNGSASPEGGTGILGGAS
jgi:hypothetical protein